ncbi:hypothetical protein F4861DRAFT_539677 [Xylaria intraflava]|nr:hypothetical protein F4861DRAFT_539677 [Xylaria intraflava]
MTRAPSFPRRPAITSDAEWGQLCEITAHRILRNGFNFEYISAMTSVQIGGELGTGVVLVVSAGNKDIRNVRHTEPGVAEGLKFMAQDGREFLSPPLGFT